MVSLSTSLERRLGQNPSCLSSLSSGVTKPGSTSYLISKTLLVETVCRFRRAIKYYMSDRSEFQLFRNPKAKPELASFADFAIHSDRATVGLYYFLADRQT